MIRIEQLFSVRSLQSQSRHWATAIAFLKETPPPRRGICEDLIWSLGEILTLLATGVNLTINTFAELKVGLLRPRASLFTKV